MTTETQTDPNVVTLDPLMIRDIEVFILSRRLAEADAKLAKLAMDDANNRIRQTLATEAELIKILEEKIGRKLAGKIELVDREKGLCRLL